jgi:hypothetical protein
MLNQGAEDVKIFSAITSMSSDPEFELAINQASKFLFLNNEFYILEHFIGLGENGAVLADRITHDGIVTAFVGDNSRFAGKTVIENYLLYEAAANGTLVFKEGLGLLKTSVIIPHTYKESSMYMNPAAGIPYAVLLGNLRFGIWLTHKNYMKYAPEDGKSFITSFGDAPVIIIEMGDTRGGFVTKTYSSQYSVPKMIAGFERMKVRVITSPGSVQTGNSLSPYSVDDNKQGWLAPVKIFPNPASQLLTVRCPEEKVVVTIISVSGQQVLESAELSHNHFLDLSVLPAGVYFAEVKNISNKSINSKLIIAH